MALNTSQNSPSFDWSLQGSASSPFAGWLNFSAPLALADTVVSSWKRRSTGSQMAVATNALMPRWPLQYLEYPLACRRCRTEMGISQQNA